MKDFKEIPTLLPFFFFDLVARIIPGGVFVWLYWPDWVERANSFGSGLAVIFAIYTAGLFLDFTGAGLGWMFNSDARDDIFDYKLIDRRNSLLRVLSIKVFFRSLGEIFFLVALLPTCVVGRNPKVLHDNPVFIYVGLVACVVAWCNCELEFRFQRKFGIKRPAVTPDQSGSN